MTRHECDVLIVGGGMVGLCTALSLAKLTDLSITVIDSQDWSIPEVDGELDLRVSAITRASQQLFRQLGAWSFINNLGVTRYEKMHVWDANGSGQISFDAAELAECDLGHIIENRNIRAGLWQAAKTHKNINLIAPVRATGANWDSKGASITLSHEAEPNIAPNTEPNTEHWRAKLLIAADGANSWLRRQKPINISAKAYDHEALVCHVRTEKPHQKCAWQRFLSTGPLALLPINEHHAGEHQCSIVWSTSPEHAKQLKALTDDEFNEQLSSAFEYKLGHLSVISQVVSFPLIRRHTERYIADGIALVGDAAHTIHPLAGQGVNLGLMDAASLAEVIANAINKQQNFALAQVLRPYERWRRSENQLMLDAMGFFRKLYQDQQMIKTLLRNTGMNFVDSQTQLKASIMHRAMGLKGDLPLLAQSKRDAF